MAMGTELPEDKLGSGGQQRAAILEARDEKLIKLLKMGVDMKAISARLGVHPTTLAGRARKLGWRYDRERQEYRYVDPTANAGVIAAYR